MTSYLYVAAGSAVGGVARYAIGSFAQSRFGGSYALAFPVGTLLVNVSGSFLLGAIMVATARQGSQAGAMHLFLAIGLCGGYTTFSTFSAETLGLVERGALGPAALNIVLSVSLALAATFAGVMVARAVMAST